MPLWFTICRAATFAIFIICNAIICSLAAWNLSMEQSVLLQSSVEGFTIFVSVLGLLFLFPIIFIDVANKNAITGRVWFELSWLSFFFVLELCAATAVSVLEPGSLCIGAAPEFFGNGSCSSLKAAEAFLWICTITVLSYLILLISAAVAHRSVDKQVWRASVRGFPWFSTRLCLENGRSSPVKTIFVRRSLSLAVPKPRRAIPPPIIIPTVRTGMDSRYEIEHYGVSESPIEYHAETEPKQEPKPQQPTTNAVDSYAASFYPQHVQTALKPSSNATTVPRPPQPSPPPPLGNWPRVMAEQPQPKPKKSTTSTTTTTTTGAGSQQQRNRPPRPQLAPIQTTTAQSLLTSSTTNMRSKNTVAGATAAPVTVSTTRRPPTDQPRYGYPTGNIATVEFSRSQPHRDRDARR